MKYTDLGSDCWDIDENYTKKHAICIFQEEIKCYLCSVTTKKFVDDDPQCDAIYVKPKSFVW